MLRARRQVLKLGALMLLTVLLLCAYAQPQSNHGGSAAAPSQDNMHNHQTEQHQQHQHHDPHHGHEHKQNDHQHDDHKHKVNQHDNHQHEHKVNQHDHQHDNHQHDNHQHDNHKHDHQHHTHTHQMKKKNVIEEEEQYSEQSRFYFSLLASFIVSLLSFSGAICLAFGISMHSIAFEKVKLLLMSLAVGSLLGDTMFHLVPVIFGAHSHGVSGSHDEQHTHGASEHHNHGEANYGLFIVIGFMMCLLVEMYMRGRSQDSSTSPSSSSSTTTTTPSGDKQQKQHSHHHHHHHHSVSLGEIKPFGWLNLIGDGIHNFMDGISMGSTFHQSFKLGVANTLCIIFHEIPQELSDFGVLLSAGFSVKRALLFNFLSGVICVIGCLLAKIVLHQYASLVENKLLLAITAGTFLYIACADMVPEIWNQMDEIKRSDKKNNGNDSKSLPPRSSNLALLVITGIVAGLGVMILVGKLEHIVLDYVLGNGKP